MLKENLRKSRLSCKRLEEGLQTFILEYGLNLNLGIMDDLGNPGESTNISHAEILEIATLDQFRVELVVAGIVHDELYLVIYGFDIAVGIDEDFYHR